MNRKADFYARPDTVAEALKASEREWQNRNKLDAVDRESAKMHNRRVQIIEFVQRHGRRIG